MPGGVRRYSDLGLLVIQTRSPLAARDFGLIGRIPCAWLSVTTETDDQELLRSLRGGPALARRFALVREARQQGIRTQITVRPCMPYTATFAAALAEAGAARVVVDTCVEGDGSGGQRTADLPGNHRQPGDLAGAQHANLPVGALVRRRWAPTGRPAWPT